MTATSAGTAREIVSSRGSPKAAARPEQPAPRLGFAYSLDDRTVLRGGYGLFFTQLEADAAHQSQLQIEHFQLIVVNDGRPDFAVNPFNGPAPACEQVLANACDMNGNRPGCLQRSVANEIPFGDHDTSFSHMCRKVSSASSGPMALESNYVWTGGREGRSSRPTSTCRMTRRPAPTTRSVTRDGRFQSGAWCARRS